MSSDKSFKKGENYLEKSILEHYSDSLARVKYLQQSVQRLEGKLELMNKQGYYVTDTVNRGRKGKKSLGNVTIAGFPSSEYARLKKILDKRKDILESEEHNLLERTGLVEEYISKLDDVEIRNILSLYYVEELTWLQVSFRMNTLYRKKKAYTESSCRQKHDRFFEKVSKTAVMADAKC
jgi:hypothetical protein